jgi:Carboxypeptidase regulatory-like domain/TonB dependent receptor
MRTTLISALAVATLGGWQALAQTSAGIKGVLTDTSGALVPAAEITVTNLDTGARRQTLTNETGVYDVPLLQPGRYTIVGRKVGFKQATRDGVELELNQIVQIDFVMLAGEVTETIEVQASAPLLESNTSSVGQVIEKKAVSDLPLNGRNFVQLAILGPGVTGVGYSASGTIGSGTRPDDMRPGTELFSNGNREQSNNFMLDGVDNNFRRNGLITLRPAVEAVLEFKIQTNLFQAEQGRNPGATINVITKSGSNSFHGSAYEFLRNTQLDAKNFFAKPGGPKAQYQQNQFGASLGGPIRRDKVFFFADYEGFRKRRGTFASVNTVPTAAIRSGDFSSVRPIYDPFSVSPAPGTASGYTRSPFTGGVIPVSRFDAVTGRLIQAYPLPETPGLANNEVTNPVLGQSWDQGDIRTDYALNPKTTMFGRFSQQDTLTLPPSSFGLRVVPGLSIPVGLGNSTTYAGTNNLVAHHAVIAATHIFSSTFIVDARFGYGRFNLHALKDGAEPGANLGEKLGVKNANQGPFSYGLPIFSPSNYTGIGGPAALPTIRLENTFNPNVSFTKVHGKHSIRFGTNIVRRQIIDFQTNQGDGLFSFDPTFTSDPNNPGKTGDSMASFLLGTPASISQDFLLVWPGIRTIEIGSFVQDDWKVTTRLTLNIGLRYEYTPPPVEVHNQWATLNLVTGKLLIAGVNSDRQVGVENDGNNWAPRFGFAYRARQHTVIRGGFGIFYNTQGNGSALFRLHRQLPFGPSYSATVDQFSPSPARVQDGLPPIPAVNTSTLINSPSGNFNVVPPNYKTGYAQQGNFGVEQELPKLDLVLKAAYVTNLARQVDSNFNINTPDSGPGPPASRRPLRNIAPGVVNATYGDTTGVADYHSLQVTAERRFSKGLAWLGAYTYSHSIDNVPTQQGGGMEGPVPQDIRYRFLDRGNSSFDIRHRTSQSVIYDLPFGNGRRFAISNPFARALFSEWQVNGILTLQGGLPFTPTLATSVSNAGGSRPDRLAAGQPSNPTLTHWFDTSFNVPGSAWATPRLYSYGDGGRNILRGPSRANLDCSIFREVPIAEPYRMQFRAEFFNAFNHPQFDLPNATIGSAAAGVISSTVGSPRDIQLSLRLMF